MKRGEIYFIKSTYREEGSEQRADRPAVIVSNDKNNMHSEIVEVCYLTKQPKKDLPTHVLTRSALSPSTILCEQVSSVSTQRIGTLIGQLTESELKAVDTALAISLGLDFGAYTEKVVMREPTEEELEAMMEKKCREALKQHPGQIMVVEPDADRVKLETERDLYKKFSEDLVEILKERAKA